jgi:integrase
VATVYRPKGRNIYRIEFKDQFGRPRKISSGTDDKRFAESLALKLEEDAERIRFGREPLHGNLTAAYLGLAPRIRAVSTWKEFRKRFEAECLSGLRPRTREKYGTVLDVFEQEMRPTDLLAIDEGCVSRFANALRCRPVVKHGTTTTQIGLAPWTIRNYLIALKTALNWAKDQRFLRDVPKFPLVKVPRKKPQPIAVEDFTKLLAHAPNALWRAFLLCGWWAGLRLSEVRELRWDASEQWPWLDGERGRIVLPAAFAKSGQDQWVPLNDLLHQALTALPRTDPLVFPLTSRRGGDRLSRNGITNRVLDMAQKAGVKLSMHRLRKGFGCRVAQQLGKGNAPILHRLMRHSSMQITMDFYAALTTCSTRPLTNWTSLQTPALPLALPLAFRTTRSQRDESP